MITFISCSGIKPSTTKSGKKLYETFFVGEEGTQYFIKPLTFYNNSNEELKIDLTFRDKSKTKDITTINLSFISKSVFKEIDSIIINNNNSSSISSKNIKHLFSERSKEQYKNRFSSNTRLSDIKELFKDNDWTISIYKKDILEKFTVSKSSKKNIPKLNYEIFELL